MSNHVRDAYDAMAARYASLFLRDLERDSDARGWLAVFAELAAPRNGAVADLGCGPGHVVDHLSELGLSTIGYDISPGQIAEARRAFPDSQFHVGDLAALDVADSSLGGIVARYSLIHLLPSRLGSVFEEWMRVLEPGAPVLVSFFGSPSADAHGTPFDHKVVTAYALFPATIAQQMQDAGFGDVEIGLCPPPDGGRPFDQATVLARKPGTRHLEEAPTMARPSDNKPTRSAVLDFLRSHHGAEPTDLEILGGGFWSAAYGYRLGGEEFVLRINDEPDGFRSDEFAMRYRSPGLPIPEVLTVGEAFGRWFAISRRHHGRFLEEVGPGEADVLGPTVVDLLAALRAVPDTGVTVPPWRDWLLDGISDRPGNFTSGWRSRLAANPGADRIFRAADGRIRSLLDACPDRRQLVHSDLLHYNVLVSTGADALTAVFSWKCSTWGDAVYDLAWCTFWGRWHDGIGALGLWDRVVPTLTAGEIVDIGLRHHAYELQIGINHLGWYATLGDDENLGWTLRQLDHLLERGPLG